MFASIALIERSPPCGPNGTHTHGSRELCVKWQFRLAERHCTQEAKVY